MKNKVSFSIIVPTYNNCEMLNKTIERLLNINYDTYEIIIINDGSTDGTKKYLESLNNEKIKIINQKNKGVSCARNTGIRSSSGDYIIFVDDDDIISLEALQKLSLIIAKENPNIVKYSGYTQYSNGEEKYIRNIEEKILYSDKDKKIIKDYLFRPGKKIDCYVWLIAVKNEKSIVLFNEKMKYLEDEMFYIENFTRKNIKITTINEALYTYIYNKNSKTKDVGKIYDNIDDLIISKNELQKTYPKDRDIEKMISANVFKIMFARYRDARNKMNVKDSRQLRQYILEKMKRNNISVNRYYSKTSVVKYLLLSLRLY